MIIIGLSELDTLLIWLLLRRQQGAGHEAIHSTEQIDGHTAGGGGGGGGGAAQHGAGQDGRQATEQTGGHAGGGGGGGALGQQ